MTTEHAILVALQQVHPLMMAEETLHIELNLMLPRAVSRMELKGCLERMQKLRWIVGVQDALVQKTLWKLSTQGQAVMHEHSTEEQA